MGDEVYRLKERPISAEEVNKAKARARNAGADVAVRHLWGPADGRALWAECDEGSGLHTYPDLEVLEVLDPITGEPTEVDGDLTVTTSGWLSVCSTY